ncbi:Ectonucleotide pyrophosphatase/phosphodiesterase family member 5 [Lamellibrachia satsuma]|nr:Ectonucleotide pyrophosphatase/phosphodiesterase family member 5 [Lamellibrachia satsuma]
MAQVNSSIKIDNNLDSSMYKVFGHSPVWNILPRDGKLDEVYNALKKIQNLTVYKKEDIPDEFHYKFNRRIQPIVIVAAEGYNLCDDNHQPCKETGGNHGYSNALPSMHPFFIAHGPVFKRGYVAKPFNSVDVYPLICKILHIKPAPNNGSLDYIQHILKSPQQQHEPRQLFGFTITAVTFLLVVLFAAMMSGICCIAACRVQRIHTRHLHPHLVKLGSVHFGGNMRLLTTDDDEDEYEEEIP